MLTVEFLNSALYGNQSNLTVITNYIAADALCTSAKV